MIHKKTKDEVWVDGLGYCVEVKHTDEVGQSYISYTPKEQ